MDLIKELKLRFPDKKRLQKLITDENVSHVDNYNRTPLMYAFECYGTNPNCDSDIFNKILNKVCIPEQSDDYGYTALMHVFIYNGKNPNCDSSILLKLLNMKCAPDQIDNHGYTALMCAFLYYGRNPNCNSHILSKMLDMNCLPNHINRYGHSTLMFAFRYYGSNPKYDPNIFLKLIILLYPSITRPKLIEILDKNTTDRELKNNILGMYDYNRRRTIINNRVSKRVSTGKYDSLSIFD